MTKQAALSVALATAFFISTTDAIARPQWTRTDSRECRSSFKESYIKSSGGLIPPNAMANDYCNCAEFAYKSGDTMSAITSMCAEMVVNKYL